MNDYLSRLLSTIKKTWCNQALSPNIIEETGTLAIEENKPVFVMVCGPEFDMMLPNAGTTCRLGWCHGFEEIGIPFILVNLLELSHRLSDFAQPICFLTVNDYQHLNAENMKALKKTKHFVWVNPWFENDTVYYTKNNCPNLSNDALLNVKVLSSEPEFIFTISPESSFEYFHTWLDTGAKLVSLPLACDTSRYNSQPIYSSDYENIRMAFVGGYWPYKAIQFDRYLKPYQDILKVFGYSPWPYTGYAGKISAEKEPELYRQVMLCPTINEPHVEKMGIDLNERVFKVLGSGGMTVTDVVPGYKEWFAKDELLVPESISEYHDIVHTILNNDDFSRMYRKKGREAVLSRHTYAHRAKTVLEYLGM